MFNFSDKIVIVTGGARGIGKAVVEGFLQSGAKVIATYTSNDATAQELKSEHEGKNLDVYKFDVSNYADVEAFYKKVDEKHGRVDILVNNAGIRKDAVVGMMKEADWRDVINVNLTGVYNMCKFATLSMIRQRSGRIINITSPAGEYGFAGQANYSAAKAGEVAFTKSLSKEIATRGITVNCVSPGYIDTDFIKDIPENLRKEYIAQIPQKRFGNTKEVANCVLFLASDFASYVNGSTLKVTGGL